MSRGLNRGINWLNMVFDLEQGVLVVGWGFALLAEIEGLAGDALVADADDAVFVFAVGADDSVVDELAIHLRPFGRVFAEDISPCPHLRLYL
jgi:hypothetical protein